MWQILFVSQKCWGGGGGEGTCNIDPIRFTLQKPETDTQKSNSLSAIFHISQDFF